MKIADLVFATTHVDAHGERLAYEALQGIVDAVSRAYIPVGVEHDPRIPPRGRVRSASIRETSDGEYEVVAEAELFEVEDGPLSSGDGRKLVIHSPRKRGLSLQVDRTFRFDEDREDICRIEELFGNPAVEECKKALDPVSVVTIAGTFVITCIATGFFGQIGADGWNLLKRKLSDLFARKENRKNGLLLVFCALVASENDRKFEVQVILADPSLEDIEDCLPTALQVLDQVLPTYIRNCPEARRFVFEMANGEINLKFVVRNDCLPLYPTLRTTEVLELLNRGPKEAE
jgi:hypothetical protein